MKYEIGDRVRVVGVHDESLVGKTFLVEAYDPYEEYPFTLVGEEKWRYGENELELVEAVAPRIDPAIITRLNEVVTMLKREKRRMSQRMGGLREYTTRDSDALRRYWEASNDRDAIVARIEAVTKVIAELTKEA